MKLEMNIRLASGYCDDCGHIDYADGEAILDGKVVAEVRGDNHLGGGPTNAEEVENHLLRKVLSLFDIEFDYPDIEYENDSHHDSITDLED